MEYFPHTTIIQPSMRIRRERMLPRQGEIVVRVGQEVTPTQVLARAPLGLQFNVVRARKLLNVSLEAFPDCLLVSEGDKVEVGTPLAQKKRLIGQKVIESPMSGTIARIQHGRIAIKQTADWYELRSMVRGRVVNYINQQGITIEIVGTYIQGLWSTGSAALGKLQFIATTPTETLEAAQIIPDFGNQIMVAGHIDQYDTVDAAIDAGVQGIITGSISAELAPKLTDLDIVIITTDGFGTHGMAQPIYDLLKTGVGEETTLFGFNKSEQRTRRPEIIIPRSGAASMETAPFDKPLAVGQQVRIFRQPYIGQIGIVEKIRMNRFITGSGIAVHGADIRLPNDQIIFAPIANLDALI